LMPSRAILARLDPAVGSVMPAATVQGPRR
jgi:hypothetical protein